MVQWLRFCISNAWDEGSIPGQGTKVPHAMWCSQKRIFFSNNEAKCLQWLFLGAKPFTSDESVETYVFDPQNQ